MEPLRPTLVLLNPNAGGGRAGTLAEPMRAWLAEHAPGVALVESDSAGRARATLQCMPRNARVVLVGGDGTLQPMLPVLLTHRLALGLVPVGHGNDSARAFGLHGLPWQRALQHALTAPTSRVDVGEVLGVRLHVLFVSSLAAGFDAAVVRRAGEAPAWLRGRQRCLWATLAELASLHRWNLQVRADGVLRHDGPALFASAFNTATYGAGIRAAPAARINDGRLDLVLAGRFGRLGALSVLPRLLRGRHLGHGQVSTWPFQTLQVDSDEDLPLVADGEVLTPQRSFELRVRASALQVAVRRRRRSRVEAEAAEAQAEA